MAGNKTNTAKVTGTELPGTVKLKEETLRWIFSILAALLVYYIIAVITQNVYHPDIAALKKLAADRLAEPDYTRPEPMEALLFRLGVLTVVPCILLFYYLFSRKDWLNQIAKSQLYTIISVACIIFLAVLIYADFAALNPYGPGTTEKAQNKQDGVSLTNFDFYFTNTFLGSFLWLYAAVLIPLIAFLFFKYLKKTDLENKKPFKITTAVVGYLLVAFCIVSVVVMNTFNFPYANENKYDFAAVYYSMTQVYAGLPMLVDHLTNTYGLYPHFLQPIFSVIGMNIFKFSLVMSLLAGLSLLFNFYALKKLVSNQFILFLGFAAIIFFPYFDFKVLLAFDCVFSYVPIRYLVPSTLVFLSVIYFQKKPVSLYWFTFVLSAMFILWNPEMGLVCYISWILVNIYSDYYTSDGKPAVKKMLYHVIAGILIVCAVFYAYKLIIYLAYGSWPDLSLLFSTIALFGNIGVGALPMSSVHPWNLMALVLILGFTYAVVKWFNKEITHKSTLIMLVSLIALGYFAYFQGRSQDTNFAMSSAFCFFLLTILGDELWTTVRKNNILLLNALFVAFLFLVSFSVFEIAFNAPKIVSLYYQEDDKANFADATQRAEAGNEFITKNNPGNKKLLLIMQKKTQPLFIDGYKRKSAFNPGFIDLFFEEDAERLARVIKDSSFRIFIEPTPASYVYMGLPFAALAASYEYKAVDGTMVILDKRKHEMGGEAFFDRPDNRVFYRKYSDDSTGINNRISDAMGVPPVVINPEFSAEMLFLSTPQMYPESTLIGYVSNNGGFVFGKEFNSFNFFFAINKTKLTTQLGNNKWVYMAINVFPDSIAIYSNNQLVLSQHLKEHITRQPDYKLAIGNFSTDQNKGQCRFYVGPIAEVSIRNKALDPAQISTTWAEINRVINKAK